MKPTRNILTILLLLLTLGTQAFAANLNTTSQWRNWQQESRTAQRLSNECRAAARGGTSAGYNRAAAISDQIANIHTRYANVFENMASYSNDRAIKQQAAYQGNSRRISARSWSQNANTYRRHAANAARRGR